MQHVTILFENPNSGKLHNLAEKCHSLNTDLDKFAIAKINKANEVEFLSKGLIFKPTDSLDQLMFDNRFELFVDTYAAEKALGQVINKNDHSVAHYLYQVSSLNRSNDTITLNIVKKF